MIIGLVDGKLYEHHCEGWFADRVDTWRKKLEADGVEWKTLTLLKRLDPRFPSSRELLESGVGVYGCIGPDGETEFWWPFAGSVKP